MKYDCVSEDLIISFLRIESNSSIKVDPVICKKEDGTWLVMGKILINKNQNAIEEWKFKEEGYRVKKYKFTEIYQHIELVKFYTYRQFLDKMNAEKYSGKIYELNIEQENQIRNKI